MKTNKKYRQWSKFFLAIVFAMFSLQQAIAWDWEWTDERYVARAWCDECDSEYTIEAESSSDAESAAEDLFCSSCGSCAEEVNSECYREHHCQFCGECIDNGDYHDGIKNLFDEYIHNECAAELIEGGGVDACTYCYGLFGEGAVECDCEYSMIERHCTDCAEEQCEMCGICMVIDGEETDVVTGDACVEHLICNSCMETAAAEDQVHCRQCFNCDEDVCDECGLCESCALYEEHCPECGECWGNEVAWCESGGEHCLTCCTENEWKCNNCGKCTEGSGLDICSDCDLCEECCHSNSESEGCDHGYCIASSDYEDHLCLECGQCPQDEECEYCELCADCQADYHCEHELCPDGSDWDDHVCPDCGECFDEGDLCEQCGLCENCREHCDHDFCSEDDDDSDHFICDQCGDCYEDVDRCDQCRLCTDCCQDNTSSQGCDHDFCIESDDFAEHWCYEDDQCLELCEHDENCEHSNVSTDWSINGNAHWQVCDDCGLTMNKAIHTEGDPVTLTAPNAATRTNGTAQVSCAVCNYKMGLVSIPYVVASSDGKPYIISQPTDYTGKTNTSAYIEGGDRYATFKVKAGGENLSYQWYEQFGTNAPQARNNDWKTEGAQTATLKVLVHTWDCEQQNHHKYYCVVTNSKGSVTTNTVYVNAQHVFGRYAKKDGYMHENACFGECGAAKSTSKHRFGEWTLVKPATSTEPGRREQPCMDCEYKNTQVIAKVEPDHVHSYDFATHSITQHWFVCKCFTSSPEPRADHNFDQVETITAATEKKMGEEKHTCTACGFSKTVKIDKLPHEHDWWTVFDDPAKGGTSTTNHYNFCKGEDCDQKKIEQHVWGIWIVSKMPIMGKQSFEDSGQIVRQCSVCGYEQKKIIPYGNYPVLVQGGKPSVDYAPEGATVTITYDNSGNYSKQLGLPYPVMFKRWRTAYEWYRLNGGRPSSILESQPTPTIANPTSMTTTITMPAGPAIVYADYERCTHRRTPTRMGQRMEPTCTSHGHEADEICMLCGGVVTEGARIPALGHDLPSMPLPNTEEVYYCTVRTNNALTGYVEGNIPNPEHTHGYTGDFKCNRCDKTVKGKKTPLAHGLDYFVRPYTVDENWEEYRNQVEPTCTTDGRTGEVYCKFCDKLVERSTKIPRHGHEWEEWNVVREATTKVKGMECRVCANDESHIETRITDYSGPDYALRPDKTRLHFEWTYGDPAPSQTISIKSVGRNEVTALTDAIEENDCLNVNFDGMTLTVTPKDVIYDYETPIWIDLTARTKDGETIEITLPEMAMTCVVKKTAEKYTLTVEDGLATTGTLVGINFVLDANSGNKLQMRGGVPIRLEPAGEWREDFLHWEVVEDASGLLRDNYDIERTGGWGPSSSPNYGNRWTWMSPNNVTVRAIYKKNDPTLTFSVPTASAQVGMPFTEPKLRTTPGSLRVTYTSSDPSVATVDAATGKVTAQKGGTVTITATFAGNAHYSEGTASYTLTITDTPTGINQVDSGALTDDSWYSLDGKKLATEPKQPGVYIYKGKKVVK